MSVKITTLPSGLRVVTDAMPGVHTAALGVYVPAGSRHEAEDEHGLSHLLEHMAFKGTKRRSAKAIAEEIENAGGDLNAATSIEQTAYYARVLADDTGLGFDILADILTQSVFDPEELAREKSVILQEIGAVEDTPDDLVFDLFNAAAFPDQPIGRPILGTPEKVNGFDRSAIEAYLSRHYAAPSIIIAAAGALEHERIVEEAARHFGGFSTDAPPGHVAAKYVGGDIRVKRKLEQTHIVVGFEGRSFHDPANYATHIFSNAVGGGMSSRLFQEVRERRGLAYSIYSFNWTYADTGVFGFAASCAPADVAELMPVALDCIAEASASLDEVEVRRAKAQMKVSLLTALESSGSRAEQIARHMLAYGHTLSTEDMIARIDALTLDDVRKAGATLLSTAATVAAIGTTGKVMDPVKIAGRLGRM